MINKFTGFITTNHMGIVKDLSEVAFYLKNGNEAKIWPVNAEKTAYILLAIEYAQRQSPGYVGLIAPPTLEKLQAHQVIRIGNDFKPKETRFFACCSKSYIGIMTSAESAVDAYSATGCTLFIAEVESPDDAYLVFHEFYCRTIKWKAGYFKAVTFPGLPPIQEFNVLYTLPYSEFLANEDGIPPWMNFDNPLIGPGFEPPPLPPGGGDGNGSNG